MAPKIRPIRARYVIVKTTYFSSSCRIRRPPKEIVSRMYDNKAEARIVAARWRLQDLNRAFNRPGVRRWICVSYKVCEVIVRHSVSTFLDTE